MIKCVIIDDELNCIEMLEWLLATYCPSVTVAAVCKSGAEGIAAIRKLNPDLVFLDIEMPNMNGFDMLNELGNLTFDIVFTTAYDQFAIKAFKYSALNYLLKPVDADELEDTIRRVEAKKAIPSQEQIELLLAGIKQSKTTPSRIALTITDGMIFVPTSEIVYCEAESNYCLVVLASGKKVMVSKILKEIEEALSGPDFFRVHNSYLVNLNRIQKFVRGEGGYLLMEDSKTITIARSRRQEFMELFARF